jgi:DNA primase
MDHRHAQRGLEYLSGRGIDLGLAAKFGLRYHPQERRVIFPIMTPRLVGWQARAIDAERQPKILTGPKSFTFRDRVLMGQGSLHGADSVILTEGPVDMIKCSGCGPAVVCAMGKFYSDGQIEIIARSDVKRVYLALDPDVGGQEKERLAKAFSERQVFDMVPPATAGDFGEMAPSDVLTIFRRVSEPVTSAHQFLARFEDFFPLTVQGGD